MSAINPVIHADFPDPDVVRVGDCYYMVSIVGTPRVIDAPYVFEDSGMNKIGGKYYYSYCSNWQTDGPPGLDLRRLAAAQKCGFLPGRDGPVYHFCRHVTAQWWTINP